MTVQTTYENMRDNLREKLNECLKLSKEMFDDDIWGYSDMKEDYSVELYCAIKRARDKV